MSASRCRRSIARSTDCTEAIGSGGRRRGPRYRGCWRPVASQAAPSIRQRARCNGEQQQLRVGRRAGYPDPARTDTPSVARPSVIQHRLRAMRTIVADMRSLLRVSVIFDECAARRRRRTLERRLRHWRALHGAGTLRPEESRQSSSPITTLASEPVSTQRAGAAAAQRSYHRTGVLLAAVGLSWPHRRRPDDSSSEPPVGTSAVRQQACVDRRRRPAGPSPCGAGHVHATDALLDRSRRRSGCWPWPTIAQAAQLRPCLRPERCLWNLSRRTSGPTRNRYRNSRASCWTGAVPQSRRRGLGASVRHRRRLGDQSGSRTARSWPSRHRSTGARRPAGP